MQWGSLARVGLVAACALALSSCNGLIGDPGSSGGGPGGPGGPTGPGTNPGDPRFEVRMWRLSPAQFDGEVARLFGDGAPEVDLPAGASEHGITNISATARIDLGNASLFVEGARTVATWAAANGATTSRCTDYGMPACIDTVLGWLPESAFRRPVTDEETTALRTLFEDLSRDYDYDFAYAGVVRAVLLSPHFLYRSELGDLSDGIVTMTDYEIANLLSFSITDRAPDDMLLADAAAGRLREADAREAHARRLMEDSGDVWQRFFWEWLAMSTLESQGNEVGLPSALVTEMQEEHRAFVTDVIVTQRGTLSDLLTSTRTFASPELAAYYGAAHSGSGVEAIDLDFSQRAGLLTRAAWLVSHGKRGRANVVRRGMGIYRDAMCNDIAPLMIDLQAALSEIVSPDAPVSEIVQARGNDPTCGSCHALADPIGLAFESYAGDGTWQTVYASDGLPVETGIELEGVGPLPDAMALSAVLADDVNFQHCMVQRFVHFLMGIDVGSPDAVRWSSDALSAFVESGGSFEELLVAIVRDPSFVERRNNP